MLEITNKKTQEKYHSKINLIDLAGAEKLVTQDPIISKETASINKSLTALSNVILALSNKQSHIPYRDNKLTYILKDSLNSNVICYVITGKNGPLYQCGSNRKQ